MKIRINFVIALMCMSSMSSISQTRPVDTTSQVITTIKTAFVQRNKNIERIQILDIKTIKGEYLTALGFFVLANGVRADYEFKGNFGDELFSLFQFDKSLHRIVKTYDFIPTPRWRDYDMWIEKVTTDSVTICGAGASYGDEAFKKSYHYLIIQ